MTSLTQVRIIRTGVRLGTEGRKESQVRGGAMEKIIGKGGKEGFSNFRGLRFQERRQKEETHKHLSS